MGCPRRLFAAAALWLVTSSQRAARRDLGASSAATSGQRYKPQRVATYAGPRLGDTVNRSASPLPRPWSACERCGVVTTINPPSEAILRVGNASGWCLVVVGDRKTADGPYEAPRQRRRRPSPADDVVVAQLLANHDPDVDAIYRLGPRAALPLPFDFPSSHGRGVVLDGGAVCPFNAQATLFDRAAFWALLLPASVHGRVADIWRGFVAQRRGPGSGSRSCRRA
ncbi:hypothetical protein JL721_9545 [Aureococcus anophagefferens]|nr:hypothetical protein JL721_9545 [Aureococcus anophagefferens]